MDWASSSVNLSFGMSDGKNNVEFSGKNAVITSLQITQPSNVEPLFVRGTFKSIPKAPEPIEVTMEFMIPPDKFTQFFDDGCATAKISQKKVEDCSVRELLFAIRYKLNKK